MHKHINPTLALVCALCFGYRQVGADGAAAAAAAITLGGGAYMYEKYGCQRRR
jgi:hypothetical protein